MTRGLFEVHGHPDPSSRDRTSRQGSQAAETTPVGPPRIARLQISANQQCGVTPPDSRMLRLAANTRGRATLPTSASRDSCSRRRRRPATRPPPRPPPEPSSAARPTWRPSSFSASRPTRGPISTRRVPSSTSSPPGSVPSAVAAAWPWPTRSFTKLRHPPDRSSPRCPPEGAGANASCPSHTRTARCDAPSARQDCRFSSSSVARSTGRTARSLGRPARSLASIRAGRVSTRMVNPPPRLISAVCSSSSS